VLYEKAVSSCKKEDMAFLCFIPDDESKRSVRIKNSSFWVAIFDLFPTFIALFPGSSRFLPGMS
jgi:hypothetical protein